MNLKAVIALALAAFSAPTIAADNSIASKLTWAVDVGTHIYDVEGMESFKPSLEMGIFAKLPLKELTAGTLMVESGFSQTLIYGSSELYTPQPYLEHQLSTAQIDFRRLFVNLAFETNGTWFFKPQIGLEHNTSKLRLYDPATTTGFTSRESDYNVFVAFGVGHRFADGKKAVLSLATLADKDDQDFRLTLSASY